MTEAQRIEEAFRNGDLEALRSAAGDPPELPNCWLPAVFAPCLEYAIYHSPLPFIRTLIELGADPNYEAQSGFPSLFATLSTKRQDEHQLLDLLLEAGADVDQRGLNDWTPLHYAAVRNDPAAVELLISRGADPAARTRIDDFTTPLEEARRLGHAEVVKVLEKAGGG